MTERQTPSPAELAEQFPKFDEQEWGWLVQARLYDVHAYLSAVAADDETARKTTAKTLSDDIRQDMEHRYPPGYAGLYPYEE